MDDPRQHTVTRLLHDLTAGNRNAFDDLLPLVYDELHALAGRQRRRWTGNETLNTTALVHEAYLRLVDQSTPRWQTHAHFLAVASKAMRQLLLDYAKRQSAAKRGGRQPHVPLDEIEVAMNDEGGNSERPGAWSEALLALEQSLTRLEEHNRAQSQVVECRFFGGLSIHETADALGISPATVKRRWAMAQAWLYRDLKRALGTSA